MSEGKDEFEPSTLDDALSDTSETVEETAQEAAETQEQVELSPEAVKQEEKPVEQPETPQSETQPEQGWTYHAYKDVNDKWQSAKSENEQLKAQLQALQWQRQQAQQKQPQFDPNTVFDDPEAFARHVQQQTLQPVNKQLMAMARNMANIQHGADTVDAANAWFDTLPPQTQNALWTAYGQDSDPFGKLVQEHKKALISEKMSNPETLQAFEQWQAQQSAAAQPQPTPAPQAAPQAAPVKITPSVTSAPNMGKRGGTVWSGPAPIGEILA